MLPLPLVCNAKMYFPSWQTVLCDHIWSWGGPWFKLHMQALALASSVVSGLTVQVEVCEHLQLIPPRFKKNIVQAMCACSRMHDICQRRTATDSLTSALASSKLEELRVTRPRCRSFPGRLRIEAVM